MSLVTLILSQRKNLFLGVRKLWEVLVAFKFVSIGGFMLGIEYLWEHKVLVLDLGIVRIFIARKS